MLKYCKQLLTVLLLSAAFATTNAQDSTVGETVSTEQIEAKPEEGGAEKFNAAKVIFGHISDAYEWHLFTIGDKEVAIHLPIIAFSPESGLSVFSSSKLGNVEEPAVYENYTLNAENGDLIRTDNAKFYDISITKNVASMLISVVLLILIAISVANKYKKNGSMVAPSGFQNAFETVIIFVRDEIAKPNIGHKYGRFMPLMLTMFFFIWINNLLGLLPGGANLTGNLAVTACLALVSFLVIAFSGNKHYWGHIFNPPGVPVFVKVILIPVEILSMFIKPIALSIRLFANILAGHIVILSIISLIFIFGGMSLVAGWGFSPVSLAFVIFMFFLELLVAAIQAFIFTNLTAVFIGQAVEDSHESHHDIHGSTGDADDAVIA